MFIPSCRSSSGSTMSFWLDPLDEIRYMESSIAGWSSTADVRGSTPRMQHWSTFFETPRSRQHIWRIWLVQKTDETMHVILFRSKSQTLTSSVTMLQSSSLVERCYTVLCHSWWSTLCLITGSKSHRQQTAQQRRATFRKFSSLTNFHSNCQSSWR